MEGFTATFDISPTQADTLSAFYKRTLNGSKVTVTTGRDFGWRRGDRLRFHDDTNRCRRFVTKEIDSRAVEVTLYLKPSKGFRRHLRRAKAERRA